MSSSCDNVLSRLLDTLTKTRPKYARVPISAHGRFKSTYCRLLVEAMRWHLVDANERFHDGSLSPMDLINIQWFDLDFPYPRAYDMTRVMGKVNLYVENFVDRLLRYGVQVDEDYYDRDDLGIRRVPMIEVERMAWYLQDYHIHRTEGDLHDKENNNNDEGIETNYNDSPREVLSDIDVNVRE